VRADDNEESLRIRLMEYYKQTSPLIGYYHAKGLLKGVDGLGEIDEVARTKSRRAGLSVQVATKKALTDGFRVAPGNAPENYCRGFPPGNRIGLRRFAGRPPNRPETRVRPLQPRAFVVKKGSGATEPQRKEDTWHVSPASTSPPPSAFPSR
jgi:hypothetical protein